MTKSQFDSKDDALEAQQQLLEDSLPLVFVAYDDGLAAGMKHPVVFLLDCDDAIGSQIARSWLGDDAVDDAIAALAAESAEEQTPVYTVAFPLVQCRRETPKVFPYLSPALDEKPPRDGFLAICVTAGGASIFTAPHSARPAAP